MTTQLIAGGNAALPETTVIVRIKSGVAADVAAFRLNDQGKTRVDDDFVFYGQKQSQDRALILLTEGAVSAFSVNLAALPADVQKVAFTITPEGSQSVQALRSLAVGVEYNGQPQLNGDVDLAGRSEAALILGELYRRNGEWKFRFVAQGFNGGLQPLAEHYGVTIDDTPEEAAPAPAPAPAPAAKPQPVNLSKVTLTKEQPTINLTKSVNLSKSQGFGRIRVNLNWNRGTGGGFFSKLGAIDLDLGAYVRLKNGEKDLIQALGNRFGRYDQFPYVHLEGDDRTGSVSEGEWLNINGAQWDEIAEVVVFAFIYKGAPNWAKTDGVVTLQLPEQPPVETRLTEGGNRHNMCAIARLENVNGTLKVERLNDYFAGHEPMDKAYGWGFNWRAGSK
ncbi:MULTISPECIES: TerD family protein [Yersiniaceae]|uniref:Tellurium resistance protein TerA n=1 Tax=Chimaeribacter arupi TaxID=2060066 RepID=A0A2N5EMQ4_9GAMM|nr:MULTISPECIES: TerD family protein [Yersiniaceae]PLR49349.1 tellurium resistance protein TerA [Chimaeribacter arupi]PLR52786.1 tellurium resistance protein TerA [Chimaeribacter arupi]